MADTGLAEKARALYAQREAANAKCLIRKQLPVFTERFKPLQFWDYFYDSEQELLRSNDNERIGFRNKKTNKIFKDDADLQDYLQRLQPNNESSHDEDRPPASEELFLSDDKIYDQVMNATKYCPPLTRLQRHLLHSLSPHVYEPGDTIDVISRKRAQRIALIRGYCKELKRKRYARTYHRFRTIRAMKMRLNDETMALCEQEIYDKGLTRTYYYDQDEPSEMKTLLQRDRSRAVQRKYKQYQTDPDFRRCYRNQVYFNVNQDVPASDDRHMHGHTVLVYDDDADKVHMNRSLYGAEAQMHRIRVKRIESSNRTMADASGLGMSLNDTRYGQYSRRTMDASRNRSMSPAARDILRKHGLDEPTHDHPDESYERPNQSPPDDSYDHFLNAGPLNSTPMNDEGYIRIEPKSRRSDRVAVHYPDDTPQEYESVESSDENHADQSEYYEDEEQSEIEEEIYEDTTEYDEDPTDFENYTEQEITEDEEQTETGNDEETGEDYESYKDETTDYERRHSDIQSEDTAEIPGHNTTAVGQRCEDTDDDDDEQFEDSINCADEFFNTTSQSHYCNDNNNIEQSMNATASFASMDDEFAASSELDFISDDFDDAPETPGWTKPMSRHKMALFQQIGAMERQNVGNNPSDVKCQREAIIRKYHISIIKRRRQQAINRIQEVLRQGLSIQSEAARLQRMELHDKMLDRGFYYHPREPPQYAHLLKKRRNAIALKYEYYANYDQFRRQYQNRVLSGKQRPIEPIELDYKL